MNQPHYDNNQGDSTQLNKNDGGDDDVANNETTDMTTATTTLTKLPSELLVIIFKLLNVRDLARLSCVSKYMNKLSSTNELWMILFKSQSFNCNRPLLNNTTFDFKMLLKLKKSTRSNWQSGRFKSTVIQGHSEPISSIQYNGQNIISSSYDGFVKIWDYETFEHKHSIPSMVECMQFDHSNKKLICGTKDGKINLIDIERGKIEYSKKSHYGYVSALKGNYNSTIFCTGSKDKKLSVWNLDLQQEGADIPITTTNNNNGCNNPNDINLPDSIFMSTIPLDFKKGAIINIEWSGIHRNQITCAAGNLLKIVDINTEQCIQTMEGHDQDINCFNLRDNIIVSAGRDSEIYVWDVRDNTPVSKIPIDGDATVYCLQFEPRNNVIVTGSGTGSKTADNNVRCYQLNTNTLKNTFQSHTKPVTYVDISNDHIVSASLDSSLWVFNTDTDYTDNHRNYGVGNFYKLDAHTNMIRCTYVDETKIISGSYDHTFCVWDFASSTTKKKDYCSIM